MAVERTLSIIKPDAVAKNVIGEIYARFEKAGLKIVAARMRWLSRAEAEGSTRCTGSARSSSDLVDFMMSGPVMIQVLEGENAIAKNRDLMGATDPKKAAPGTIRADFAQSSTPTRSTARTRPETAATEIAYLLPGACTIYTPLTPNRSVRTVTMTNLLDLDRRGAAPLLRRTRREAVSRAAGVALGPPALRRRLRRDDRPGEAAARARSRPTATIARPDGHRATRPPPTARASGCSTSATATRSRRSTFPRTTAARCASRRRPAARSTARSARPASRASTATSRPARSSASCGTRTARCSRDGVSARRGSSRAARRSPTS